MREDHVHTRPETDQADPLAADDLFSRRAVRDDTTSDRSCDLNELKLSQLRIDRPLHSLVASGIGEEGRSVAAGAMSSLADATAHRRAIDVDVRQPHERRDPHATILSTLDFGHDAVCRGEDIAPASRAVRIAEHVGCRGACSRDG